jgi:hypothetical protein
VPTYLSKSQIAAELAERGLGQKVHITNILTALGELAKGSQGQGDIPRHPAGGHQGSPRRATAAAFNRHSMNDGSRTRRRLTSRPSRLPVRHGPRLRRR